MYSSGRYDGVAWKPPSAQRTTTLAATSPARIAWAGSATSRGRAIARVAAAAGVAASTAIRGLSARAGARLNGLRAPGAEPCALAREEESERHEGQRIREREHDGDGERDVERLAHDDQRSARRERGPDAPPLVRHGVDAPPPPRHPDEHQRVGGDGRGRGALHPVARDQQEVEGDVEDR